MFRIQNKTPTTAVDGASEYLKSFGLFGAPRIDEANSSSISEIRHAHDDPDDFAEFEEALRNLCETLGIDREDLDFEFLQLSDIWDESDFTLPRRIRCIVHCLALLGVFNFPTPLGTENRNRQRNRQREFWDANAHAAFKSK